MKRSRFLALSAFYLAAHGALADQALPRAANYASSTVQVISAIRTEIIASDRLAGEFEPLAGSHQNAQNLVVGLRNAKAVRIVALTAAEPEVSFTPPTRPMSFSDIHHALLLAQAHLQSKNIANPTPAQIKASLAGGELPDADGNTTTVIGILPLHRRGMSWDAIARALHVALPKKTAQVASANTHPPEM